MRELQRDWKEFVETTFPLMTQDGQITKLAGEFQEFLDDPSADEAADCIIVLMSWANVEGIDLEAAVRAKIERNRARTWQWIPEKQYYQHV